MRFLLMLPICLLMLTANGSIYLNSGLDSYGKGLSYPGQSNSTFQFSVQNATGFAPFYMDIFLDKLYPANLSAFRYKQLVSPIWNLSGTNNQRLGLSPVGDLYPDLGLAPLSRDYKGQEPAVENFFQPKWKLESADHQVPAFQEFLKDDWKPSDPSSEDYRSFNEILKKDDRMPEQPLL